jgi:DNA-directed RNA polymerase specialized sigma24 family protein
METRSRPDADRVYREQRLALLRLAFLLTGSADLAEDIVQTAFAASWGRWEALDDPLAYLRRVVVNQAKDAHRRRYRGGARGGAGGGGW